MDRIIQSFVDDFTKSQEIQEKDMSKKFELFATYCAVSKEYSETFDIEDVATGAEGDGGIDGLAIIANGQIINSKEEIEDIVEVNKHLLEVQIIFVQAKMSSSFEGSEIGTFGAGVKDILSESPKMVLNESMQNKHDILEEIIANFVKMKDRPICTLYYMTTGKWVNDQNCQARIEMVKSDLAELNIFDKIQFYPVDCNELQRLYRNTINVVETEIIFSEKILLPEIEKVTQSYLGYVDYREFLKLVTDENGTIRKSVFYDNVRDYQGDNPVNTEIADTICNAGSKFILLNNGITIICKKLTCIRNKFTLVDYQIVNGCQTSHELFNNQFHAQQGILVMIKIIETTDEETINSVVKATNRQTQISQDQLLALNEFHRRLEDYYKAFPAVQRLYYERRSKQYSSSTDVEKVRIVTIKSQIKSVAAMFYDKPHLASRYYGKLLQSSLKDVFSDEHKQIMYYTSSYALYKLDCLFRRNIIPTQYKKFRFYILMMLKYRFVDDELPRFNSKKMEQLCEKMLQCINDSELFVRTVGELCNLIDENVKDITDTEMTKSGNLADILKEKAEALV